MGAYNCCRYVYATGVYEFGIKHIFSRTFITAIHVVNNLNTSSIKLFLVNYNSMTPDRLLANH